MQLRLDQNDKRLEGLEELGKELKQEIKGMCWVLTTGRSPGIDVCPA